MLPCTLSSSVINEDAQYYLFGDMGPDIISIVENDLGREVDENGTMCANCFANIMHKMAAPARSDTVTTHMEMSSTIHEEFELQPSLDMNVCVWCRSSLYMRRTHALPEGPEIHLIAERISQQDICIHLNTSGAVECGVLCEGGSRGHLKSKYSVASYKDTFQKMRPARSRRVQAQRKFAQGAYVPPIVIAVAAADNRQDVAQDQRNVTINRMAATCLLDVVSLQGSHTHPVTAEPVVLLEKLRDKNPSRDTTPQRETVHPRPRECHREIVNDNVATMKTPAAPPTLISIKKKKKRKNDYNRVHPMTLRSRRLSKLEFNRIKAMNGFPNSKVAAKRKHMGKPDKAKPKKKFLRDQHQESSDFSVDDNKPLMYFAKDSSTPKQPVQVVPVGPTSPVVPAAPVVPTTQIPQPYASYASPEPIPGPSGMQLQYKVDNPETNEIELYYSDHKIQYLMDEAFIEEFERQHHNLEEAEMVQLENGVPVSCIAVKWRSVQDVINATKEELESRCQVCKPCMRIKKLMQLSDLLKTQVKIDLTGSGRAPQNTAAPDNEDADVENEDVDVDHEDATASQEEDQGHLYLDLLPVHPALMMKLKIHMVHGKELLSACLIPRTDSRKNKQEFLLMEQEHLLDQLIETLTLSQNDNTEGRRMSLSSIESTEASDYAVAAGQEEANRLKAERKKIKRQKMAAAMKRLEEAKVMHESIKKEKELEVVRIESLKRQELLRIEAEKKNAQEKVSRNQTQATRMNQENIFTPNDAEMARIRAEIKANLRAEMEAERMVEEVDHMARALEKEKDAKIMDAGTSSDSNIYGPSTSNFPQAPEGGKLVDAPVFRPTKEEFDDPIAYFEKIWPETVKYGICKVVPPEGWKPKCRVHDDIRFDVTNQYISRLFSRWGPAARELCAIKLCLRQQKVNFTRPPLLDGVEVNLPKLYHLVQRHGGLETVINKKRWGKVAEDMKFNKMPNTERKLDQIYVKYLLPYDTLSHQERQEIMRKVEKAWNRKNQKLLDRAMNPLHRQKRMLGLSDSSDDESEEEDTAFSINEAEDCITKGSVMNRAKFKRVATNAYENVFGQGSEAADPPPLEQIEEQYWRHVLLGTEHLCVHTAAIDTGEEGFGFTKNKNEPYGRHPWNLKMISQNSRNVLRYLGAVIGVTVPTLLLGMLFSTSCWHKDPHSLPWIEFQHSGPTRIWYGVPSDQTDNFRKSVETLCPTSCQNKELWLSSDIAMIPPQVLRDHNVSLARVTQEENEFILALPRAYTCCISTGYTESESVYFAPPSWLENLAAVFKEARESCEPTMFSMEHLLFLMGKDQRAEPSVLKVAQPIYEKMQLEEVTNRQMLQERGLTFIHESATTSRRKRNIDAYNARDQDECEYCRATLFLSKVKGLTSKNSVLCLEHALKLLDTKKYKNVNVAQLEVFIHVSVKELNSVGDDMKRRIGKPTA